MMSLGAPGEQPTGPDPYDEHYDDVQSAFERGALTFVLGAGASLYGRSWPEQVAVREPDAAGIAGRYRLLSDSGALDDRGMRVWAAAEAQAAGPSGVAAVAAATGMAIDVVEAGVADLAKATVEHGLAKLSVASGIGAPGSAAAAGSGTPAATDAVETWLGAPSATELSDRLARKYRLADKSRDLTRVAQFVSARKGSGELYSALRKEFARPFPSTALHDLLGRMAKRCQEAQVGKPMLIATTNYDDLIENALCAHGVEHDVLVYMAEGPNRGKFCHAVPNQPGAPGLSGGNGSKSLRLEPIKEPSKYLAVDPEVRTVVVKLHGFVCRGDDVFDSYVITEDHYIEYLTRTQLDSLLPAPVLTRLLNCSFLFLGYSLRDWNLRAILHQIYNGRLRDNPWWAVLLKPHEIELKSWKKRNVELINMPLEQYVPRLAGVLGLDTAAVEAGA